MLLLEKERKNDIGGQQVKYACIHSFIVYSFIHSFVNTGHLLNARNCAGGRNMPVKYHPPVPTSRYLQSIEEIHVETNW